MANKNLNAAKTAKKDEFYTQLTDIERELQHYWQHFRDKVVLCNCDDPYESNFFKYFALRFNQLGLKKLICTCYNGSPIQGNELMIDFGDFTEEPKKIAYKVEITEVKDLNGDGAVDLSDVQYLLKNDKNVIGTLKTGDFRDPECIELLKQADIVVTNPPFSLFREYISQLMEYKKKFLIIGNQNAITYKEIYPLILNNELWMGYHSGHTWFAVPDDYEIPDFYDLNDTKRLRSNGYAYRDGRLWRNLGNICWFTNLDHQKRHEEIDLICRYSHEEYPYYENYDAIEVNKATNIPYDYEGKMGVPVTFLEKYNPEQFEIIGISLVLGTTKPKDLPKSKQGGPAFYIKRNGEYQRLFARIVIRNKHPQKI
ncbi:adenine-specific methyltransferase EcoRI family protein [Prevotella sp. E13-17]|uniref:adenine-specific methyltransferase EcoRI family protein n=1 Tax=Prevotella sp. E13-17 TaxID=2913616 RepID=UPI001EDA66FD|nr:adenine-specific methyltransferase EcoRI family protein [Prevotella sp. E13-17]UKK51545.1 adenine-specific methyltransferase EcoRI family protein [Prevotella sp. E13-17]